MKVKIKQLSGEIIFASVEHQTTIEELISLIYPQQNKSTSLSQYNKTIKLTYRGHDLELEKTIKDYEIKYGDMLSEKEALKKDDALHADNPAQSPSQFFNSNRSEKLPIQKTNAPVI